MSEAVATSSTPATPQVEAPQSKQPIEQSNPQTQAEKAEAIRKYKVKVDGEELEVDEKELLTGYQTRKASDKKFMEAANARKQAEEFVSLLKSDPIKVLSHPSIGHDVRKLAEEYLINQLQEEALTPEQKELKAAKNKLKEYEEQERKKKADEEQTKLQKLQEHYTDDYTNKIIGALEASTLPKTSMTIKRMAYYLHRGLEMGIPVDVKDAAELVKQDYIDEQKHLFGALDEDTLVSLLDKDVLDKIRKAELKKAKSKMQVQGASFVGDGVREPKEKKSISKDEWRAKLEAIKNS